MKGLDKTKLCSYAAIDATRAAGQVMAMTRAEPSTKPRCESISMGSHSQTNAQNSEASVLMSNNIFQTYNMK